jgi:hypothetical protein
VMDFERIKNLDARRWRSLLASAILVLFVSASATARAQDDGQSPSSPLVNGTGTNHAVLVSPLVGTWIFSIGLLGAGVSFNSLISFTPGGVLLTSGSIPGPSSPSYGSWRRTGRDDFTGVFYAFYQDATGKPTGTGKVTLRFHMTSRDELAGTAVGLMCDLQGENCVQDVEFQYTGKRILPER